jgi:hypothetical protein
LILSENTATVSVKKYTLYVHERNKVMVNVSLIYRMGLDLYIFLEASKVSYHTFLPTYPGG